ncbi:hypothetical protein PBY51_016442 [Eleginops maclovinus]|uniref:Uncharacterized protein n=1 Tax=Eleginops maclovinus TaxID=56733 RepID=A0AAN7XQ73_ELEMC|nr:hypothetical protein PBY51_016442 [Eleginops maclovinus]
MKNLFPDLIRSPSQLNTLVRTSVSRQEKEKEKRSKHTEGLGSFEFHSFPTSRSEEKAEQAKDTVTSCRVFHVLQMAPFPEKHASPLYLPSIPSS